MARLSFKDLINDENSPFESEGEVRLFVAAVMAADEQLSKFEGLSFEELTSDPDFRELVEQKEEILKDPAAALDAMVTERVASWDEDEGGDIFDPGEVDDEFNYI